MKDLMETPTSTSHADIQRIVAAQREQHSFAAPPASERRRRIEAIEKAVLARRGEIRAAMRADLDRPAE